jgi:hypothetical protein
MRCIVVVLAAAAVVGILVGLAAPSRDLMAATDKCRCSKELVVWTADGERLCGCFPKVLRDAPAHWTRFNFTYERVQYVIAFDQHDATMVKFFDGKSAQEIRDIVSGCRIIIKYQKTNNHRSINQIQTKVCLLVFAFATMRFGTGYQHLHANVEHAEEFLEKKEKKNQLFQASTGKLCNCVSNPNDYDGD